MKKYDFAVIGGGFQGLYLAYQLSKEYKVVLIEKERKLGGLLSGINLGKTYIEKYYHHIFPRDIEIKNLLNELNLEKKLIWKQAPSGFFYKNKIYPFFSPFDLLFFKPLNLKEKIQFSLLVLKIKKSDPKKLDNVGAKEWIIKNSSLNLYKKMFEPLIINKFGKTEIENISAAWFVSRIKLRSKSIGRWETLGYIRGGFEQLIKKLKEKIKENGSDILIDNFIKLNVKKNKIDKITCKKEKIKASTFISTIPPQITFNNTQLPKEYSEKIKRIKYHSLFCLLVGLNKKVSDLYWTNLISDKKLPFGAIIEHTNFQDSRQYGMNLIYISSYFSLNSKIWNIEDSKIKKIFITNLKKLFPKIKKQDILFERLFKEKYSGIVCQKNFIKNLLPFKTPLENLYIIGMFNTYPERGLELQVKLGKKLLNKFIKEKQIKNGKKT